FPEARRKGQPSLSVHRIIILPHQHTPAPLPACIPTVHELSSASFTLPCRGGGDVGCKRGKLPTDNECAGELHHWSPRQYNQTTILPGKKHVHSGKKFAAGRIVTLVECWPDTPPHRRREHCRKTQSGPPEVSLRRPAGSVADSGKRPGGVYFLL